MIQNTALWFHTESNFTHQGWNWSRWWQPVNEVWMISVIIHRFLHLASERQAGSPLYSYPFDAHCTALWESSVSFTEQFLHYLPRSSIFHFTLCLVLCLFVFHFLFLDLAQFFFHFASLFLKQWTVDNRVKYGPHCKMPSNQRYFLLAAWSTLFRKDSSMTTSSQ